MAAIAGGEASGDARIIQGGAWYGNDTLWRTVYDLVRIARFADKDAGERAVARPILTLMDAVIAGEGNGPLKPIPRPAGLLMWGEDPGAIDLIASRLMGFDWRKIPLLNHLADTESRTIRSFDDSLAIDELVHFCGAMCVPFSFRPPMGWSGHIELQD
jgi:uncharacterized protein (DUF362 family)